MATALLDQKSPRQQRQRPLPADPSGPDALPEANVRQPGGPGQEAFPESDFANFANIPVFAEHTTRTREGKVLRFGREELQAIADRCNERIRETGDYAALTLGHTPTPEALAGGAQMPKFVGMGGPFRLGTMGRRTKKYAILADFHILKDCLDEVRRHPRRSPEVWLEREYEEMIIDPIALLGSEAPRLDLGLFYSRKHAGRTVEKYSAVAPGPANVFNPSHGDSKETYQAPALTPRAGQDNPATGAPQMNLAPEDIQAIVSAFDGLDWVQWVKGKMQTEQADNATSSPGTADELGAPGAPNPAPPAPGQPPPPTGEPSSPMAPPALASSPSAPAAADATPPADEPAEEDEPEKMMAATAHTAKNPKMNYMAGEGSGQGLGQELDAEPDVDDESPEAYSRWKHWRRRKKHYAAEGTVEPLGQEGQEDSGKPTAGEVTNSETVGGNGTVDLPVEKFSRLEQQVETLRGQLEEERAGRINVQREAMLRELASEYAFDVDHSVELARYGRMSGPQFKSHLEFIERNCTPMGVMPFTEDRPTCRIPDRPGNNAEVGKYSKQHSDEARRLCEELALRGRQPNYEHVLAEVKAGRTVPLN